MAISERFADEVAPTLLSFLLRAHHSPAEAIPTAAPGSGHYASPHILRATGATINAALGTPT